MQHLNFTALRAILEHMVDPQGVYESWVRQAQERRVSHHHVSRFYLRGFADENRRLAVLDRASGRIKTTSVKRAAAREHFYTVETQTGEQEFTVEAMLGWLENRTALVLRKLLNGDALDEQDREDFLVFMTFQIVRGPDHRAMHSQLTDWWAKFRAAFWPKGCGNSCAWPPGPSPPTRRCRTRWIGQLTRTSGRLSPTRTRASRSC
jgi:hypothetical protein